MSKREKLGWSKYRIILWVLVGASVWGLFITSFIPNQDHHRWNITTGAYNPNTGIHSSHPREYKNWEKYHSDDEGFLFFYWKSEDLAEKKTKENFEEARSANREKYPFSIDYKYITEDVELLGVAYRGKNHGKAIAIGLILPFIIFVLAILFEKSIVRKLEKINS